MNGEVHTPLHYSPPDLLERMLAKARASSSLTSSSSLSSTRRRSRRRTNANINMGTSRVDQWSWNTFQHSLPPRQRTIAYAGGHTGDTDSEEEEEKTGPQSCLAPCISLLRVDADRESPEYSAMAVDTYSRLLIPLAFFCFCLWYWPTLLGAM